MGAGAGSLSGCSELEHMRLSKREVKTICGRQWNDAAFEAVCSDRGKMTGAQLIELSQKPELVAALIAQNPEDDVPVYATTFTSSTFKQREQLALTASAKRSPTKRAKTKRPQVKQAWSSDGQTEAAPLPAVAAPLPARDLKIMIADGTTIMLSVTAATTISAVKQQIQRSSTMATLVAERQHIFQTDDENEIKSSTTLQELNNPEFLWLMLDDDATYGRWLERESELKRHRKALMAVSAQIGPERKMGVSALKELMSLARPPQPLLELFAALAKLLAGVHPGIETKLNGRVKAKVFADWKTVSGQLMFGGGPGGRVKFAKLLPEFVALVDAGKVPPDNWVQVRSAMAAQEAKAIDTPGASFEPDMLARKSQVAQLIGSWLLLVVQYKDMHDALYKQ